MELEGKVALVTGAGSGIGRASAVLFAKEGSDLGVLSDTESEIRATAEEIEAAGRKAIPLVADMRDPGAVRRAVEQVVEKFGRLDIVFANAGINGVWAPIDELQPEEWDQTIETNLRGTYATFRYAVPHLEKAGGGSIVIIHRSTARAPSAIPAPRPMAAPRQDCSRWARWPQSSSQGTRSESM